MPRISSAFTQEPYLTGTTVNETVVDRKGDTPVGGTVAYATDAYYRDMGRYERQANPAAVCSTT